MTMFDKCYSGMDASGKLIFTPWFAEVAKRYGYQQSDRGIALDSAAQLDERGPNRGRSWPTRDRAVDAHENDDDRAGYRELEAIYDRIRKGQTTSADIRSMDAKQTRGLDGSDNKKAEFYSALERAYDACRGIVPLLLLLLALPSLHAQAPNLVQVPLFNGAPQIGSTCSAGFSQTNGGPAAWLSLSSGQIYTCKITPPATTGVWALYGSFDAFQGTGNAVSMNGSDVSLFTFTLPPLAAGACYRLDYGIGAGLASATVEVKIDGTIISTPFTAASITGVDLSISNVNYCNLPGTQTTQSLVYSLGAAAFVNGFWNPNSGWSYTAGGPAENDNPISTPASFNWSVPHVLTITANQASGTVVPNYAHVSGGN